MGIFNATDYSVDKASKEFGQLLAPGERIERAYRLVRDTFIFTDKRLILIDVQGLTGKKVESHSIPYKSITHFSIESAGVMDLEAELKIYISGNMTPIEKTFSRNLNIYEVQAVLAAYVLK